MKILKWYSFLLVFSVVLSSCAEEHKAHVEPLKAEDFIGDSKEGIYRGIDIGTAPDELISLGADSIAFTSDTLVKGQFSTEWMEGEFEAITYYSYDNYGLFEIQADYFPPNDSAAHFLEKILAEELEMRYGKPIGMGVSRRWTTPSKSNNLIEITLSNESLDYGEPFISLNYLEPLDEEL